MTHPAHLQDDSLAARWWVDIDSVRREIEAEGVLELVCDLLASACQLIEMEEEG